MTFAPIVQITPFAEPEDLLAALRGSNDAYWHEAPEAWVFRGHADASWELLPAALRKNTKLTHHAYRSETGPYGRTDQQLKVEADQVYRFAAAANRQGLAIPGGWDLAKGLVLRLWHTEREYFPHHRHWELFALAQHHLVPTRFLDWSRAPLSAAYFAAHGAATMLNDDKGRPDGAKKLSGSELMGIWALNTWALGAEPSAPGEAVRFVDPPRYGNLNLTAQDGIFTVHTHPWEPEAPPLCEPLDASVARLYPGAETRVLGGALRLLTLPLRKARKLLVRLEKENVNASTLHPGYDGVVRAISEAITHSHRWTSRPDEE